jgi:hypothetical protein
MSGDSVTGNKIEDELPLARTQLDRAAAKLDTTIVTRLRAARLHAVATAGETGMSRMHLTCIRAVERVKRVLFHPGRQPERRPGRAIGWLPLCAATAAALVAVTVTLLWWHMPEPAAMTAVTEDFEWLLAKESPDLLDELEFYHWLGDEPDAG